MYLPAHFAETRTEVLHALIAEHPLGALVTLGPDGLNANHIPFLLEPDAGGEHGRLIGHVARSNDAWRDALGAPDAESLVIFQGASAYISPNWYPSKHEQHKQVPTWNYQVVHVHGRVPGAEHDQHFAAVGDLAPHRVVACHVAVQDGALAHLKLEGEMIRVQALRSDGAGLWL